MDKLTQEKRKELQAIRVQAEEAIKNALPADLRGVVDDYQFLCTFLMAEYYAGITDQGITEANKKAAKITRLLSKANHSKTV